MNKRFLAIAAGVMTIAILASIPYPLRQDAQGVLKPTPPKSTGNPGSSGSR